MSKILKVSDETHERIMALKGDGETVDDVLVRQLQTEPSSELQEVLASIEELKVAMAKALKIPEKIASEATPQKSGRKTAGGGRPAAEVFKQPDDESDPEKPCCKLAKPCQHWEWAGDQMVWRNRLSSRIRQPQ